VRQERGKNEDQILKSVSSPTRFSESQRKTAERLSNKQTEERDSARGGPAGWEVARRAIRESMSICIPRMALSSQKGPARKTRYPAHARRKGRGGANARGSRAQGNVVLNRITGKKKKLRDEIDHAVKRLLS